MPPPKRISPEMDDPKVWETYQERVQYWLGKHNSKDKVSITLIYLKLLQINRITPIILIRLIRLLNKLKLLQLRLQRKLIIWPELEVVPVSTTLSYLLWRLRLDITLRIRIMPHLLYMP